MKKKQFLPRLFLSSFLSFLGVFLLSFSCVDHDVVPEVPIVQTLQANVGSNDVRFDLVFNKIGNIPVTEYGILYKVTLFGTSGIVPTEADSKVVFNLPVSTVVQSKKENMDINGSDKLFYRAYAKLSNGDVIFGETLSTNLITQ